MKNINHDHKKDVSNIHLYRFYPEARFGGYSDVDGTVNFYSRIHSMLSPDSIVLDVGCGRGAGHKIDSVKYRRDLRYLKGRCHRVIGIDLDPDAASNPGLDEFCLLENADTEWPVADNSIDLLISDFVLEHIENPTKYFYQVSRVLKSGGVYCARTSNRIGYVGLAAQLIPNRQHVNVLAHMQPCRAEIDIFPTRYRINTVWAIRRKLRSVGLNGVVYGYDAEPSYLGFTARAFALGKILHSITPSALRSCLLVFAFKPDVNEE